MPWRQWYALTGGSTIGPAAPGNAPKNEFPLGVGERLHNRNFNPYFCAFDSPVRTATLTAKWQGNPLQVPISPLRGPELKKMTKTNAGNVSILEWPQEAARLQGSDEPSFGHAGSNLCLDFHGDPKRAGLVVFSDGNHHMALEECPLYTRKQTF